MAVQAQNGTYQRNTSYTILTATGGVTGTYAGVTSNLAFLTPSLSYGGNAVTLTLLSSANSFRNGAQTPNQARGRHRARPGQLDRDRRLRHRAECALQPRHQRRAPRRSMRSAARTTRASAR